MNNPIANWWRSYQFRTAIQQGNHEGAKHVFKAIQRSGSNLSSFERLFQENLKLEKLGNDYKNQVILLRKQINRVRRGLEVNQSDFIPKLDPLIVPNNSDLIEDIKTKFKFNEIDRGLIQCTGIDEELFQDIELALVSFLQEEIDKIPVSVRSKAIQEALEDLDGLKRGVDPNYDLKLTPHLYLMKYFLPNLYCSYLAWFLIYQTGLLPVQLNILDLAAGPGTLVCGLALFLQSYSHVGLLPSLHISYSSLDKQRALQYRGLQFWRRYMETCPHPTNAYFQFNTLDLFDYHYLSHRIPKFFFDFVTISHCFFSDTERRCKSHQNYRSIFDKTLKPNGHALIIVQGNKLRKSFDLQTSEDCKQEKTMIKKFLEELGLKLEWYKYLSSTGQRQTMRRGFSQFAKENLPICKSMTSLQRQYLNLKFDLHYAIDDYVILAKR